MLASRFRSSTELALAALLAAAALGGCSDDDPTCGPGDAPADGITLTAPGLDVRYASFTASDNNDCPEVGNPSPPTSLTVFSAQTDQAFPFTLCVRRPDRLGSAPVPLGVLQDAAAGAVIEDVQATAGGCAITFAREPAPTGSIRAEGVCDRGINSAGFALSIDGEVSVTRTCGASVETVRARLSGRVAVRSLGR